MRRKMSPLSGGDIITRNRRNYPHAYSSGYENTLPVASDNLLLSFQGFPTEFANDSKSSVYMRLMTCVSMRVQNPVDHH